MYGRPNFLLALQMLSIVMSASCMMVYPEMQGVFMPVSILLPFQLKFLSRLLGPTILHDLVTVQIKLSW